MKRAYIPSRSGQLHYREAGTADGAPLALLHQAGAAILLALATGLGGLCTWRVRRLLT